VNTYLLDISDHQAGLDLAKVKAQTYAGVTARLLSYPNGGAPVVDPSYPTFLAAAKANHMLFAAYVLFHTNVPVPTQVADAKAHIGDLTIPVMIDAEPDAPSTPSFAFIVSCYDEIKRQGLVPGALYDPRWYWSGAEGSPNLTVRPWRLVSSAYGSNKVGYGSTEYASLGGDAGQGWNPYGGLTPSIWQFGSQIKLDGYNGPLDADAFRGSEAQLVSTGLFRNFAAPTPPPAPKPPAPVPGVHSLNSPDGTHVLAMQNDGNLVIYHGSHPIWSSGTAGK